MKVLRIVAFLAVLSLSFGSVLPAPVQAQPPAPDLIQKLKDQTGGSMRIDYHTQTGKVNFIGTDRTASIAVTGINGAATTEGVALGFLNEYGSLFGVSDPAQELTVMKTRTTGQGDGMIRYQQMYRGVSVMGAELTLITDGGSNILSASGEFLPDLALDVTPTIDAAAAQSEARALVNKFYSLPLEELTVSEPYLTIYDPAILGGPGIRRATLAWRMEVSTVDLSPVRELVLVDAANGSIALHFNQIDTALYRKVYDKNNAPDGILPGSEPPTRIEGGAASSINDVNWAYEFAGETYNYFFNNEGRDSIDGAGMQLISTTRFCYTTGSCPYPNAFWSGTQMVYGQGYSSADDVVGHEMTHGVTDYESKLFYYYQSGAINESLSDIFGEFVDLSYDYRVTDTPANKWLMGEDLSIGAIRDMENPPAYGDPDKVSSTNYDCDLGFADNGGVHTNSGIANKAAFLITDGGTFNGLTITGIGMTKASKIWYYLNTNLLQSASDFKDLYNLLPQACGSLIGTAGITISDCQQVNKAVIATEMSAQHTGCAIPTEPAPCAGLTQASIWSDNFDRSPLTGWAGGNNQGGNHWYQGIDYATTNPYSLWGDDYIATGDYYIYMTSGVTLTAGQVYYLTFNHAWDFEFSGSTYYDGGILEYSINGGVNWLSATSLFSDNPPNRTLSSLYSNPLGGTVAFSGMSYGYTTSKLNLGTLTGQTVRFRFRIGTDSSGGWYGWFIDDMNIYYCGTPGITVTPTSGLMVTEAAGAGHTATFTVKLDTPPSANVSIGLSSSDTSEGTVSPASLTFTSANYSTPQTVTITGVADSMYDTDKPFSIITAAATSTDPNYNGFNASDVTVTTINSDPPPQISFSSATYSVGEAGGSSTITVSISGAREDSMGVSYATSDGTATAGSDYTTASGTLSFAPADSSKTFAVTIANDTIYEGNETVNLTLSSPGGGAVLGGTSAATLTITDNDTAPVISLSAATYSVIESNTNYVITVSIVNGSGSTGWQYNAGVTYATSNGSATAGSDYTTASGTLTFVPADTSETFTVTILNDASPEGSETFNVTLSAPSKATLGTPAAAVVTIIEATIKVFVPLIFKP